MSRRRDWRQNPPARSERKRPKMGSGERGHGVGMARAGITVQVEGSQG